jgi:CheY-like chemotaxis protein
MKLLIIAGPYEADRIRRAATSAGFETVAVEPGESLSGWISATRPDLIVMAPQMVNHDPRVALAKVRATPRGRVPIFFVGDAADEERFKGLADGFFVRPIAPADLVAQARARVVPAEDQSGWLAAPAAGSGAGSAPKNLPAALGLRPLAVPPPDLLRHLADSIDASLDAEMREVARDLVVESAAAPSPAVAELRDEGSQQTREVESDLVVRMMMMMQEGDGAPATTGPATRIGAPRPDAAPDGVPAPHESGTIGVPDIALLLGRIACDRLNGRLTFRRGLIKKVIFFEKGAPVLASSNLPDDRMGEMLARQGRLTREQRIRGSRLLESTGRRIGSVLVEIGALKESELGPLVQRHFEEIIYSVFSWPETPPPGGAETPGEEGEWTLGPERVAFDERIRLDQAAPALIMEGIRRKYTAPRLLARLGGGGQVIRLATGGAALSAVLDDMALSDEERTLARRFDGARTLDEIRADAQVPDDVPCGLAWALMAMRLASAARAVADMPAAPAPIARAAVNGTGERQIDRARILSRYALVQDGDYFAVLGLAREASAHEVRRAHQALSREMSATSLDPALVGELGAELGAIRAVLDEGARVLGDAHLRQRYQAHLPVAPAAPAE